MWTNRDPGSFHLRWDPGINTFESWKYSLHLPEFSPTLLAAKILAFLLVLPQFSFFQTLVWPRVPTHFYTAFLFSLIPSMISFTLMTPKLSKFISLAWFFHKSQKLSVHLLPWYCLLMSHRYFLSTNCTRNRIWERIKVLVDFSVVIFWLLCFILDEGRKVRKWGSVAKKWKIR